MMTPPSIHLAGLLRPHYALLAMVLLASQAAPAADFWAYAGTYTNTGSKGIYLYRFQPGSGRLAPAGLAVDTSTSTP
jgi:hypothetical protein